MKYILDQDANSTLFKFFQLQSTSPVKGDWVSQCKGDIKQLDINLTFNEIQNMKIPVFKSLVVSKIKQALLSYLLKLRKTKGKHIIYKSLHVSDYIKPNQAICDTSDVKMLFALRNETYRLSDSYQSQKCICLKSDISVKHINECEVINLTKKNIDYSRIYNGTIIEQKYILEEMKLSINKYTQKY